MFVVYPPPRNMAQVRKLRQPSTDAQNVWQPSIATATHHQLLTVVTTRQPRTVAFSQPCSRQQLRTVATRQHSCTVATTDQYAAV